jgi:hypothetical protein
LCTGCAGKREVEAIYVNKWISKVCGFLHAATKDACGKPCCAPPASSRNLGERFEREEPFVLWMILFGLSFYNEIRMVIVVIAPDQK